MKITPLILFILLLFTLVLSLLFSKYIRANFGGEINSNINENFINFNNDEPSLTYSYIPQYSSSSSNVLKLYDNIFYDTKNGNVIEVDGSSLNGNTNINGNTSINCNTTSGTIDKKGLTINSIYVVTRDGNKPTKYSSECNGNVLLNGNLMCNGITVKPTDTNESKLFFKEVLNSWYYYTETKNTDKYMISYMPWNKLTMIHIINNTQKKHICSFLFDENNTAQFHEFNKNMAIKVGEAVLDTNPLNGRLIMEPLYNTKYKILQISSNVKFDIKNSNLIIKNNTKMEVYNRYGNLITDYLTNPGTVTSNTIFQPFIVSDNANNMILYMQLKDKTGIAYITMKDNNMVLSNVYYIDTSLKFKDSDNDKDKDNDKNEDELKKLLNSYLKNKDDKDEVPSEYILKSQIVPPVCPSCPSCPSFNGSCVNCNKTNGKSIEDATKTPQPQPQTNTTNSNDLSSVLNSLLSLLKNQNSTTITPIATPATATTSPVSSPAVTTPPPAVTTLTPPSTTNVKYENAGVSGVIPGVSNYTQYGGQSSTTSDYIPITADFSSFGN